MLRINVNIENSVTSPRLSELIDTFAFTEVTTEVTGCLELDFRQNLQRIASSFLFPFIFHHLSPTLAEDLLDIYSSALQNEKLNL